MARNPDWYIPTFLPHNSLAIAILLVFSSCITSTTFGYDGSMMNGLNILPSYNNYFNLNPETTGALTASVWIGGILSGLTYGSVTDWIGRRPALLWAAVITIIGVILQTAAQNIGMFIVARIFIGYGTSSSALTGPAYLAETLPFKWRAWGLGVLNDCYYVGGLIAAGVTYATSFYDGGNSTWAWRTPSLVQGIFSVICIIVLPFVPESPRWLVYQGRREEARRVVALTCSNGKDDDLIAETQFQQIVDTIEWEKNVGETLTWKEMVRTPSARRRVLLAVSAATFSVIAGNVAASYYLGSMLDNAGVTNTTTQLQINIILNAFCLVCALVGTFFIDLWGRKPTTVLSTAGLTLFIFLLGGLTKIYGNSTFHPGIYATVAMIFLFQGAYSFGWTPVLYLYPPEVLHYPIRALGMGVFQFSNNGAALLFVFVMPIALANIGWKIYMINGAWDVLMVLAVAYFWVETKGKTLEEIDEIFDGEKHSSALDIKEIEAGEKGKEAEVVMEKALEG